MLQKRKFRIDYENIVYGKLPVVVIDIILPMGELIGLAGKLDIALRSGPNLIIPPGRKERELVV
ncbi:hypothetical protein KAW38_00820 [Candidatus Micrarchaeota archaeon]|nr:hypothetical protein [Candidatus Micrarchaeota archaeon]